MSNKMKRGLGRGLGALIPTEPNFDNLENVEGNIQVIDIELIYPNKDQPRIEFDQEKLLELKDSILQFGLIQPILVRRVKDKYEIIAGERRFRASKLAKLKEIPCIIKEVDNMDSMKIALIENIQREDLNPIEEAKAYKDLVQAYGISQEDIAKTVGKSRTYISNSMRLLQLEEEILNYIIDGDISSSHGRTLLGIEDSNERLQVAKAIKEKDINVRDLEKIAKSSKTKNDRKKKIQEKDIFVRDIEEDLMGILGTKVNLVSLKKGGKIEIQYYDNEDLERLINIFKK